MSKHQLRKLYKQRRQALTAAQVSEGSQAIARLFFGAFTVEKMRAVHCYLPIRLQKEIDTFPIIFTIHEKFLHTKVVIPRSLPETSDMEHYLWQSDMTLDMNPWGILEPNPATSILFPVSQIDAVIVPLLACDRHGHRVGYGKGFYDKFLAQCRPETLKIGVSYFDPLLDPILTDPTDVALDYCITPTRVWRF
jgi:5-formyltetrahydrofolate cyclo-ligase